MTTKTPYNMGIAANGDGNTNLKDVVIFYFYNFTCLPADRFISGWGQAQQ